MDVKLSWFKYPFDSIRGTNGFSPKEIFVPLIGEPDIALEEYREFPDNIVKCIWGKEGMEDYEDWLLLAKMDGGKYIYFEASCDRTGFDCRGEMKLYVSSSINTLLDKAIKSSISDVIRAAVQNSS